MSEIDELRKRIQTVEADRAQLWSDVAAFLGRMKTLIDAQDLKIAYLQERVQSLHIKHEQQRKPDTGPLLDAIRDTGRLLARHFSENELRDLCLDLSVSFESVDGSTPDAKAKELAGYMARRQELGRLIKRCVELRPRVYGWPVQQIDEY